MNAPSLLSRALGRLDQWRLEQRLRMLRTEVRPDPAQALLLFASPRGGSTWLEEMLTTLPATATIWEPLDQVRNPAFRDIGFWWRQHIPEEERWPEAEALFQDLFSGRMLSPYLLQSTDLDRLQNAERLVVKFVRGGLILPWIAKHFSLPKPVLLVRHPCAVVASMMHHGAWRSFGKHLPPMDPHRHDGVIRDMLARLGPLESEAEMLAAIWCLNNAHCLLHKDNDLAWNTITYEELVMRTEDTLEKVFNAWAMEVPEQALEIARRPSRTTRSGSRVEEPMAQLAGWRNKLSDEMQERILTIVSRSGVDLYDREILPRRNFTP